MRAVYVPVSIRKVNPSIFLTPKVFWLGVENVSLDLNINSTNE